MGKTSRKTTESIVTPVAQTEAFAITYGWGRDIPGTHPFVGCHYFMRMPKSAHAIQSVALFAHARDAQSALKVVRKKNPNARVHRVKVYIACASLAERGA